METLLDHAERRIRAAIANLPDGQFVAEDVLEGPDGFVTIRAEVEIRGSEITADFTGTDPELRAPLNCRPVTVHACLAYVTTAMLDPGASPNAGSLRPLHVHAPEGSLVNARYPASLVHSNIVTSQRICDVMIRAMFQAAPQRTIAACSGTQALLCIGGQDPVKGEPFTYIETHGGGSGASHHSDGQSAVHTHMTNTLNSPTEVLEQMFPFHVLEYGLQPDSEGAGRFHGGLGMRKSIRIDAPATMTIAADRVQSRPWGLEGGEAAAPAQLHLLRNGSRIDLKSRTTVQVGPGDVLTLVTPGGGGWGDPGDRSRDALADDLTAGLISQERARAIYSCSELRRGSGSNA